LRGEENDMARMREVLWKVDSAHPPCAEPASAPATVPTLTPAQEEDVPFIEVGGPQKLVEGSPSVMAVRTGLVGVNKTVSAPAQGAAAPVSAAAEAKPVVKLAFRPLMQMETALAPAAERFAKELAAFHQPEGALAEQYRGLVRDLTAQATPVKPHVLLVAPGMSGNDVTVLVLSVAITKAREGNVSVVVVDAGLQQPALARLLGMPESPGLCDVLSGTKSLQRAVRETGLAGLHALTAGKPADDAHGFLAGDAMLAVLRHLRSHYGWIAIRAPVWDGRPDLVALGCACDAAYLVLGEAEARNPAVQELLRVIPGQGIPLRGCIYAGN
jgi:Mrp family chromosome partitioning ATPase